MLPALLRTDPTPGQVAAFNGACILPGVTTAPATRTNATLVMLVTCWADCKGRLAHFLGCWWRAAPGWRSRTLLLPLPRYG